MANKNNNVNYGLFNVSKSIARLMLSTLSRIKSSLPVNLTRINKSYLFALIDTHIIHYLTPTALTYAWSFGSLLGSFFCYAFNKMHVNSFSLQKIARFFRGAIETFFNNPITISSFLITPPNSPSEISMLSWFVNQYEGSKFIIVYLLTEAFMTVIALLGFLCIYIVYKKDTFFVKEVLPYFTKLSPMRKLILGSFTVFSAIPNKFWINVEIHSTFVFIIAAIIYWLGFVFPFLHLCFFFYIILCLESLTFGLLYENSEYFKKSTNYLLFGSSDEAFAADYFHWFWG